jgi:hypothetical protein
MQIIAEGRVASSWIAAFLCFRPPQRSAEWPDIGRSQIVNDNTGEKCSTRGGQQDGQRALQKITMGDIIKIYLIKYVTWFNIRQTILRFAPCIL